LKRQAAYLQETGPGTGLSFFTVIFDADNPQRVGHFWAAALGRELTEGDPGEWATLPGDPRLDFMKVPEGKVTKNRVHLDWYARDREAEVARLIGPGATRLWDVKNEDSSGRRSPMSKATSFCVVKADG
jgi:Glyoxalase-like domain